MTPADVTPSRLRWRAGALALLIVAVDQLAKLWAVAALEGTAGRTILADVLRLDLARNSGAAFSFGAGRATWVFTLLAAAVVLGMIWFFPRLTGVRTRAAAVLLMGGATGNLIDRLVRSPGAGNGHVVDYIHVRNFPIFNVADICITVAAALFVLASLATGKPAEGQS